MSTPVRRHHRERLKKKRRFHWSRDLRGDAQTLGKVVATPTPCSCWRCRNERKNSGPSRQELKIEQAGDVDYPDADD